MANSCFGKLDPEVATGFIVSSDIAPSFRDATSEVQEPLDQYLQDIGVKDKKIRTTTLRRLIVAVVQLPAHQGTRSLLILSCLPGPPPSNWL